MDMRRQLNSSKMQENLSLKKVTNIQSNIHIILTFLIDYDLIL